LFTHISRLGIQRTALHQGTTASFILRYRYRCGRNFCSRHIAEEIGLQLEGAGAVSGSGNIQTDTKDAPLEIHFPAASFGYRCRRAVVVDLHNGTFDLIFGREFLQGCQLIVDGPNFEYRLHWVGLAK
jgi:hypothetical protein